MKLARKVFLFSIILMIIFLSSCASPNYLAITGVGYQSLQMEQNKKVKSNNTKTITVYCEVDEDGYVSVMVENNTDKIMTVDRTKSFFQDQNSLAQMYYDPTVQTNTKSTTVGNTSGSSVNLGAVANAVGIGGVLGTALSGVNVGGSNSTSTTNTNTTYTIDQPKISIPPHGKISMGRVFRINGIGRHFLQEAVKESNTDINNYFTAQNSYASANICISYSINEEKTFQFIQTHLYAATLLVGKVRNEGKVNEALRVIYQNKTDALIQPWYLLHFVSYGRYRNNDHKINQQVFINQQ